MDITKAFEQAQEMQRKLQEELAKKTVSAAAGGGMVTAVANGKQELVDLTIDKEIINPDDPDMLRDVIKAAVNSALEKSREMAQEEVRKLLGGLPIPPGTMGF